MLVHSSNTVRQHSVRVLVAIAAIFGFSIWSQDVSQAYLQAGEHLMRSVYVKAPSELQLNHNQILRLLNPFYGLTDAGDYWHQTLTRNLREDLTMAPPTGDLSLFTKLVRNKLAGITGSYVYDNLTAGDREFEKMSRLTEQTFDSSPREYEDITFAGKNIKAKKGFKMNRGRYVNKIEKLPVCSDYNAFRSLRHRLAWLGHTRPDIIAPVNILSQVTADKFELRHVKLINWIVGRAKNDI